jgi:hypothetical protein
MPRLSLGSSPSVGEISGPREFQADALQMMKSTTKRQQPFGRVNIEYD